MAYFHVSPIRLGVDSMILPGNWGRIVHLYSQSQGHPLALARELIIEHVRHKHHPDRPSRLKCAFAFESIIEAREHQRNSSPFGMIHEVEIADPSAPCHRADYKLLNHPAPDIALILYWEEVATRYWIGNDIEIPELLTESPLRVLENVS